MLMFWATLESETGSVHTLQLLDNGAVKLPKIKYKYKIIIIIIIIQ